MSGQPAVLVLFDGVCNLCNGAVQFIIRRDPHARFRFASLQSQTGQALLRARGLDAAQLYSMLVLENGVLYERSDAALRIAKHLVQPWPLLTVFKIIPRPVRNVLYNFIAANRYRWFGRQQACMLPTPELRPRFLP